MATAKAAEAVPSPARTADQVMAALAAPIPADKIRTRKGDRGRDLAYIQVPTVIDRLNEAVGPANWWNEIEMSGTWVKCKLSVRLPDGQTITREGIGGYPNMPSDEDRVKGGASDAFKRAGALMGIGLHLYEDIVPDYAQPAQPPAQQPQGKWGAPNGGGQRPQQPRRQPQQDGGGQQYGPPRSGRGLYAWAKEHGCVNQVNELAKSWGVTGKIVEWDEATVKQVYAAAVGEAGEAGDASEEYHAPADEYNF